MKEYEIWSEGYRATGESGDATFHGKSFGNTFDEAVENFTYPEDKVREYDGFVYIHKGDKLGADRYTRECFMSDEAYINRRSNWKIWGCALFDNEADARKSFG